MFETRIPKDLSDVKNNLILNFDAKDIACMVITLALSAFVIFSFKIFIIAFRLVLCIPLIINLMFLLFYKSEDGDTFTNYLFLVLKYYIRPKTLIYKKERMSK